MSSKEEKTKPKATTSAKPEAPKKSEDKSDSVKSENSENQNHSLFSSLVVSLLVGFIGGWLAVTLFNNNGLINTDSNGSVEVDKTIIQKEGEAISAVAKDVSPSVVSIGVETAVNSPFFSQAFIEEGAGTGIILTEDGLILTNRHVIPENVTSLTVILSDGTQYTDVEVVDRDAFNDVAFIQIKDAKDLKPADLGDSATVEVGDRAIAIGNALGQYANTVTSGIISGLSRPVTAGGSEGFDTLTNLFQTDASINPGNSGGPLVNINGQVIGLNTAVAGNAENIGFAIPINDIKSAITSVQEEGRIIKPYLGVRYISLTSDVANALELSVDRGAYIFSRSGNAVVPGSPADKAGLQEEDIITHIDGTAVDEKNALSTLLGGYNVGDTVELKVVRGGDELMVSATLEEAPDTLQ